jgi:hypothetical protein
MLGVHPNTVSRRYMAGIRWLHDYLNHPRALPVLRAVDWRDWALGNVEEVAERFEGTAAPGPGRPARISFAIDERIPELHCRGSTERDIVGLLNVEFARTDGRPWTRSSVRSVLRRYNAPRRPRGRRRTRGCTVPATSRRPTTERLNVGSRSVTRRGSWLQPRGLGGSRSGDE